MILLKIGCCISALSLFFAGLAIAAKTELIECPIIADTLFSGHFNEHDMNNGALQALVGKAILGIPVFRFDMSKLKHHKIEGGIFSVYPIRISAKHVEQQDLATSRKISTIAHDWIEGKGITAFPPESREWATFDWPGRAIGPTWGKTDNDGKERNGVSINVLDVINGQGGSIENEDGRWKFAPKTWTDIELDAEFVQALVDGTQYGIVIWTTHDDIGIEFAAKEPARHNPPKEDNPKEGKNAAKLVVESGGFLAVDVHGKLASMWGEIKSMK